MVVTKDPVAHAVGPTSLRMSQGEASMKVRYAAAVLAAAALVAGCTSTGQPAAQPAATADVGSANGTPAVPTPHRHHLAAAHRHTCGTAPLWRHIYHPDRLRLLARCMTVRGRVTELRWEPDGDLHILLATRSGLVNAANNSYEHGDLVLEEICQGTVTQADAVAACRGVPRNLTVPSVGDRVTVSGSYVLDADHGWMEIHPVTSLTITGTAPIAAPPPTSAPAPSGCYPKTSSGNCYEPGEFCPHADAGMTGVAGDGKTITCKLVGGYYRWED
jgi:hypothetical protein